jgi:branched-chain amino acid transport system ATP-binding protein
MIMLSVKTVNAFYGKVQALRGVSIEVRQGELVTIIGANGAGKSTLLKSISGMLPVVSGSVSFMEESMHGRKSVDFVRNGIVKVPEGRHIFPHMTVRENLEMGAYLSKNPSRIKGNMDAIYDMFPILKQKQKQKGGELSGGQQQMLAIGRGLMAEPKLLLLDEPSLGLAPIVVKEIFDIIVQLNQSGTSIILVEQNAKQALKIAHRAYVMETGTIKLEGPAQEVLNDEKVQEAYLGMKIH